MSYTITEAEFKKNQFKKKLVLKRILYSTP